MGGNGSVYDGDRTKSNHQTASRILIHSKSILCLRAYIRIASTVAYMDSSF